MKRITFLTAALISTLMINAQSFTETSVLENPISERAAQDILWDQQITGTGGIVSDYFAGLFAGVWSADDFELTSTSEITSITTVGFQNFADLETILLGYQLFIFEDDGFDRPDGSPAIAGSAIMELELDFPDTGLTLDIDASTYTFTVDLVAAMGQSLVLPPGIYWLSAAPIVNMASLDGSQRWNWYNGEENLSEAVLIDPDDLFESGLVNWTPFSTIGLAWSGLAFTIEGETSMSVIDNLASQVSIYPSPATDVINVRTPASLEVFEVALFDLQGRNTGAVFTDGTVNVSGLSRGVYMLTVETSEGTLTQKVVKK